MRRSSVSLYSADLADSTAQLFLGTRLQCAKCHHYPFQGLPEGVQEICMPGGGRSHYPVSMHTVAVGQPSDIRDVKLSTYDVTLKPGESVRIDIELVRGEGFDKNVTLDILFQHLASVFANTLPAGVTIDAKNSQTLLTGSNSKGSITLTAARDAKPADHQQCCIMANVSINFVMKATYSSRPILISVAPFLPETRGKEMPK